MADESGASGNVEYRDRWISCSPTEVTVRGYYFPWGTKRIPYSSIRSVQRVEIGGATGRARIWGTSNPRYWASFDPGRPGKKVALIFDLGRMVRPFVTPDDPDAVATVLRTHGVPSSPAPGPPLV